MHLLSLRLPLQEGGLCLRVALPVAGANSRVLWCSPTNRKPVDEQSTAEDVRSGAFMELRSARSPCAAHIGHRGQQTQSALLLLFIRVQPFLQTVQT